MHGAKKPKCEKIIMDIVFSDFSYTFNNNKNNNNKACDIYKKKNIYNIICRHT